MRRRIKASRLSLITLNRWRSTNKAWSGWPKRNYKTKCSRLSRSKNNWRTLTRWSTKRKRSYKSKWSSQTTLTRSWKTALIESKSSNLKLITTIASKQADLTKLKINNLKLRSYNPKFKNMKFCNQICNKKWISKIWKLEPNFRSQTNTRSRPKTCKRNSILKWRRLCSWISNCSWLPRKAREGDKTPIKYLRTMIMNQIPIQWPSKRNKWKKPWPSTI